ncbi:hypothetical protein WR25_05989 [Diploscapter pachys]|uniref:7TM GPCR serpentine receptor class x (Srx) domain-containing protein n=1 Tax=Diploscapter pachys TaxID=2018661 RepID=A0A2A2LQ78_9BILA|nr:hypothetical protein WR25_05989 [Diploscapter pachys]
MDYVYSRNGFIYALLFNFVIFANWSIILRLSYWRTDELVNASKQLIWELFQVDLEETTFLGALTGNSAKNQTKTMLYTFIQLESLVILLLQHAFTVFSSIAILRKIKSNAISKNAKNLNRQMLKLMLCQVAIPFVFSNLPSIIQLSLFAAGHESSVPLALVFSSPYPLSFLVNPLIIIHFVSDYKIHDFSQIWKSSFFYFLVVFK